MPKCKKCDTKFPNYIKIEGKRRNLSSRYYCLKCSPFGTRKLRKNKEYDLNSICKFCKREYIYNRKKGHRRFVCNSCNVTRSKRRTKEKAINYKGGKCEKCGYNGCVAALCFHHIDPTKKDFGIGYKGQTLGWKKIKKEIEKCLLLCQNCHHEIHYELDSKKF